VTPDYLRAALEYPPSSLGTADRLHAAVALDAGCEVIVMTDRALTVSTACAGWTRSTRTPSPR